MKLIGTLLANYEANPLASDSEVRQALSIPENRYYEVTIFPEHLKGNVRLTGSRAVKAHKISKSDTNKTTA